MSAPTFSMLQGRHFDYRQGTTDERVVADVFHAGFYDLKRLQRYPEITALISRNFELHKRPLVIDAGANIGAASVFFLCAYPSARVIAIEPEESNFDFLSRNVQGLDVKCIRGALSSTAGVSKIVPAPGGHWAFQTRPAAGGEDGISHTTINEIYEAELSNGLFPFIVKIDIEGAEADVFSQNTEWVDQTPILVVELHDWLLPRARTAQPFLKRMSEADRDFIIYADTIVSLKREF